jgi:integrase
VAQAVEDVGGKLSVKAPKTERSRRIIKLPDSLLPELAHHRKNQSAWRLKLGLGKDSNDLVFTTLEGNMFDPACFAKQFVREVAAAGIKRISFHVLRHTHITHLLRSGVPVHVVSARAGHARASITLDTYSHLLGGDDDHAAARADEMLRRALK